MSSAVKLGSGVLTLGSIGVMTYAGLPYLQKEQGTEISKLIDEEFQYKLLDTREGDQDKDKKHWEINWRNYRDANSGNDNDLFGLEGWNKDNLGDSYVALKKKCKELSTTKILDNKDINYSNVIKYCGRGVTFEEQAQKDGVKILDTIEEGHRDMWDNKFKGMDKTENDWIRLNVGERPMSLQEVQNGCRKAKEKNKQEKDYANVYASYKLICAEQEGKTE